MRARVAILKCKIQKKDGYYITERSRFINACVTCGGATYTKERLVEVKEEIDSHP